jgi:3-oxoacid CoA-transferase B subunit
MNVKNHKEFIARKVASLFKSGDVVNLGIGIPNMAAAYMTEGVWLHTENGLLGFVSAPAGKEDDDFIDASQRFVQPITGAVACDSAASFAIVRSGKLTATVLGALEVDEKRNIANWSRPGRIVGMGGAMDLVSGAKQVIVAMEHMAKGNKKILKHCRLPLTAAGVVTKIITELCVIEATDRGLCLMELAEGVSVEDVLARTEAALIIPDKIGVM